MHETERGKNIPNNKNRIDDEVFVVHYGFVPIKSNANATVISFDTVACVFTICLSFSFSYFLFLFYLPLLCAHRVRLYSGTNFHFVHKMHEREKTNVSKAIAMNQNSGIFHSGPKWMCLFKNKLFANERRHQQRPFKWKISTKSLRCDAGRTLGNGH